jgi:hypothetical protein
MRRELQPAWLVSLLNQWAIHSLRSETGGLGFASGSSWMRGLKASPASSIDPTGYAARDFSDLDSVMDALRRDQPKLWAAVTMYYKPWTVNSFRAEGYPFQSTTYYERLHAGHREIAWQMDCLRDARVMQIKSLVPQEA